jgi:hypothetical protein
MKWWLLLGGFAVGLIGIVAVIGACLPKGHRASRSAKFKAPPAVLWEALTNVSAFPQWRAGVKKVEILPGATLPRWREDGANGSITYEQVEASAPSRLVVRIADTGLPFGGTWTFQISAADPGWVVTIIENGEVYNVFFRFLSRFVFGYTSSTDAYLNSLGKKMGETISIKSEY